MSEAMCSDVLRHVRLVIESELRAIHERAGRPLAVLDVGCWDGTATSRYAELLGAPAAGIEVFAELANAARARGVQVAEADLEADTFPFETSAFDVVVANQVFEHLKNVWLPMSEIARVLRIGGHFLFSVPNLSSLHNRVMLIFGYQPSSIRTFGPHVRGFTYRQMLQFITFGQCFAIERTRGVGFYPLSASVGDPLARFWPAASHSPVLVARRLATNDHAPWLRNARAERAAGQQTHYTGV